VTIVQSARRARGAFAILAVRLRRRAPLVAFLGRIAGRFAIELSSFRLRMSPGGSAAGGWRRVRKLPAGYVPPGATRPTVEPPGGTTSHSPAAVRTLDDAPSEAETKKRIVESLRQSHLVQEATIADLAKAKDVLVAEVAALRRTDSKEDVRQIDKSHRKVASDNPRRRRDGRGASSCDAPSRRTADRRRHAEQLRRELGKLEAKAKAMRAAAAAESSDSSPSTATSG